MFVLLIALLCGAVTAQSGPNEIAFSVGLSHDLSVTSASRILYDTVFTNIGSGFDTSTGEFTCPLSGIYVFQFHVLSMQDKASWIELYKNAYYIASAYSHTSSDYSSAGNTVILTLTKGDQVFIKTVDSSYGDATDIYGRADEIYTTFSGYMISTIDEIIPPAGK